MRGEQPGLVGEPAAVKPGLPRVYGITLNWNNYDFTAACLRSLQQSAYPLTGILVVDNGSADGSVERLEKEFGGGVVEFIRNNENLGFSAGMNVGIRHALDRGADMIFSVNYDTEMDPSCLDLLVQSMAEDPGAGVVGPSIMYYKRPDTIWQSGGYFRWWRAGVVVPHKGGRLEDLPQDTSAVSFLTGCAILIRREVFERIGLLDTAYFMYCEDIDFDLRAMNAGWRLLFVPRARLWHKIEDVASDRTSPFVLYHLARSTALLFRKRFERPYRWYALGIQFMLYTPFRFWQIWKGRTGWKSCGAWLKGLLDGAAGRESAWRG